MTNQVRYSLYALLSAIIAAVSWVLTEVAVNFYVTPSIIATMWAGLIGGVVLVGIAQQRNEIDVRDWDRVAWGRTIIGGFLIHGIGFILTFIAAGQIGAGKANLLGQLQTFFVVGMAVVFLGESLSPKKIGAVVLALIGSTLISFDPSVMWITWGVGETFTIVGRIFIAIGIILMKPLFDKGNAAGTTGLAMIVGAIFLFAAFPFIRTTSSPNFSLGATVVTVIALIGIGRGLSWLCFNAAQRYIGASQAVIIFLSYAFFTILFQAITVWSLPNIGVKLPQNLGMALIGGIFIAIGIVVLQTD